MLFFINTLLVVLVCVSCEQMSSRRPKTISFVPEENDIDVGLDFSIPFIKIPVMKSFHSVAGHDPHGAGLSKVNINPMAVIISSIVIFAVSVFGPLVHKVFDHEKRFSRAETFDEMTLLNMKEHLLMYSGGCPERLTCWISQTTRNTHSVQTWKQMMSNKLLSSIVNTTALREATTKGMKGYNCEMFGPCPIQQGAFENLLNSVSILTRSETQSLV